MLLLAADLLARFAYIDAIVFRTPRVSSWSNGGQCSKPNRPLLTAILLTRIRTQTPRLLRPHLTRAILTTLVIAEGGVARRLRLGDESGMIRATASVTVDKVAVATERLQLTLHPRITMGRTLEGRNL